MTTLLLTGAGGGSGAAPADPPEFVSEIDQTNSNGAGTTVALTVPGGGIAAGRSILIGFCMQNAAGTISCADSRGNTYTVQADHNNVTARVASISGDVTTPLQAGDTITITCPTCDDRSAHGIVVTGPVYADRTAEADGTSASPNSGNTGTTREAAELLFGTVGFFDSPGDTFTPGTGYTEITEQLGSANVFSEYKEVAVEGAYAADGTLSNSKGWVALLVTYSLDPVVP